MILQPEVVKHVNQWIDNLLNETSIEEYMPRKKEFLRRVNTLEALLFAANQKDFIPSKETLRRLKKEYNSCESRLLASVEDKLPDLYIFMVIGTIWDCPKSPFGLCVYHELDDHAHDNCVFCHDPAERK